MSKQKRNTHSPELKAKVALEAVRGLKTANEIAQEFGVHPVQVGQWKKALLADSASLFDKKRGPKPKPEYQSDEKLYGEIGRLKMELDWLKKNPESTCHDPPRLDRRGRPSAAAPPVRPGRGRQVHRLRSTAANGAFRAGCRTLPCDR